MVKQWRQLTTSTMHLAQELMNVQCSGASRSFAKEMRALKMGIIVASHQKLTTTSGEQSLKLIFGNRKSYQGIQHQSFYSYMTFEANRNSEKLSKWVSHELTTNQKCCHFEVSPSLTLCNNNEPFLVWTVMCNGKWIYMTTDEDQLSGWTEKKLQNTSPELKLHRKKAVVTVWWSVAHLIRYSFLNPDETVASEKYAH